MKRNFGEEINHLYSANDKDSTRIVLLKNNRFVKELSYGDIENLFFDELTYLKNRKALKEILSSSLESVHTLIYIDLKDFGTTNEVFGEEFGNSVLCKFATELAKAFRDFEAFRVEADIFALLKKDIISDSTDDLKKQFDAFFLKPLCVENETIDLFGTIVCVQEDNELIKKAELSLREAKRNKQDFLVYSDGIFEERKIKHERHKNFSQKIITAIKEEKIFPVFQPIYSNKTNRVERYESLARLRLNNNEVLMPDVFIPIAKRINKYHNITRLMIKKTLEFFYQKNIGVSLNISLEDITNEEMVDFIIRKVENFDSPKLITFEILEDSSIAIIEGSTSAKASEKSRIAKKFFDRASHFGCSIAIDDFGSGYSNFINILTLKPNIIKIDGSIIENLKDPKIKLMAELFIKYAKGINCEVVAEFVGDKETQEEIQEMGISYSQGFYIGKPSKKLIEKEIGVMIENQIDIENLKRILGREITTVKNSEELSNPSISKNNSQRDKDVFLFNEDDMSVLAKRIENN